MTLGVGLIVALLFVIFEVGIRHVPPDGMTYTQYDVRDHWDASGHQLASTSTITSTTFTAANDQQVIDTYYHGLNDGERHDGPAGGGGCMALGGEADYKFDFTWHGIVVQSWSGGPCTYFLLDSGGIPNLMFTFRILPSDLPLPPR